MTLAGLKGISTDFGALTFQSRIFSMSASVRVMSDDVLGLWGLTFDREVVVVSKVALEEDPDAEGQFLNTRVAELGQ